MKINGDTKILEIISEHFNVLKVKESTEPSEYEITINSHLLTIEVLEKEDAFKWENEDCKGSSMDIDILDCISKNKIGSYARLIDSDYFFKYM